MNTKEKILHYLDFKDISQGKFCRKIGVSNGFLSSGKHIGSEKLKIIRDNYIDLNMDWLIYDEGNMIIEKNVLNEQEQVYHKTPFLDAKLSKSLIDILEKDNLKDAFELFIKEYRLLRKEQANTKNILSNFRLTLATLEKKVDNLASK